MRNRLFVGLTAAFVLAACTALETDDNPTAPGNAPVLVIVEGDAGGPGLSLADALDHLATDDIVTVSGALFVDSDGTTWLCEAIAESFPPQCGGERIEVKGLDPGDVPNLQEEQDVRWSESVTLVGSVE